MTQFIIYLFETGLCLSLLYLAYWLFLRKETYFNFNRIFLVGSLILALGVPLIHVNYVMNEQSKLRETAENLAKFRKSYEELIGMLEADFGAEPGKRHSRSMSNAVSGLQENGRIPDASLQESNADLKNGSGVLSGGLFNGVNISRILFLIYIGGVLYFFVRFIYLVIRLIFLAKHNGVVKQEGFRIVEIKEDISPFSFFRFLFINSGSFNEQELQNVLEHEKAHIMHRHSLDHLFAHGLAVFQWFNPFAWQMRNALKTTHEYIADRQVINKGFELFDYQSILLKQMIGYHSVELVNNFNLKPIKKRIAMMTKNKPGFSAKLKATLVIPIAIVTFFLFADFSLRGRDINDSSTPLVQTNEKELIGFWVKKTEDQNPDKLLIEKNTFSILRGSKVENYPWNSSKQSIHLSSDPTDKGIKYELKGDKLLLKWNDKTETTYARSYAKNSLEQLLKKQNFEGELSSLTQYRILEDEQLICRVSMNISKDKSLKLLVNGNPTSQENLKEKIESQYATINQLDRPEFTIAYYVDITVPMGEIIKVRNMVRPITLRFADGGYPYGDDHSVSPLLYDKVALPRLMPAADAKYMDIDELKKTGMDVMQINLAERNMNPRDLEKKLQAYIKDNQGRYLLSLEYDKDIPYGQYLETVDMIFNVVYKFRNDFAMEKYGTSYGELGDVLQKVVRKEYPMAMSERMVGN